MQRLTGRPDHPDRTGRLNRESVIQPRPRGSAWAPSSQVLLAGAWHAADVHLRSALGVGDAFDGGFVAYPRGIGVSGFVGLNLLEAVRRAEPLEPGDVIVTNDPYRSGGLATHLTDIQVIEPYFHEGAVVGYGWAFIHCSDIGGRVPSSLSPINDEIYQEGLQIPPVKLVRAGEPSRDVEALITANSRTPEANLGDIRAMLAALRTVPPPAPPPSSGASAAPTQPGTPAPCRKGAWPRMSRATTPLSSPP